MNRVAFQGILNVVVAVSSTMARPDCTLSHEPLVRAETTRNRLSTLRLELKDSKIWTRLYQVFF